MTGPAMSLEQPLPGAYTYNALRTVTVHTPANQYGAVVAAARQDAEANGYKFQTWSPAGRPDSVAVQFWTDEVVVWGVTTPAPDLMSFSIYWNGDTPDGSRLDRLAADLRARLEPFGHVEVAAAAPDKPPRRPAAPP